MHVCVCVCSLPLPPAFFCVYSSIYKPTGIAWHPVHEAMFATGYKKGAIKFWQVDCEAELGDQLWPYRLHQQDCIWSLDWHPLGHVLASGSQDRTVKFWSLFGGAEGSELDAQY